MIIGNLLDGGIVLGLLGAESAVSSPSFILSREFTQSFMFGLRGCFGMGSPPIHRRILRLAIFVFWASVLSSLAGPASGVLMIPRVDWKLAGQKMFTPLLRNTVPNIMIGDNGDNIWLLDAFQMPGLTYWEYFFDNSNWDATRAAADDLHHKFGDLGSFNYINTTGTPGRDLGANWNGGTSVTCRMLSSLSDVEANTWGQFPTPMNETAIGWKGVKSTTNLVALNAIVTCRAREKIPCSKNASISSNLNDPEWCYMSVGYSSSSNVIQSSRNLLLATDFDKYWARVWVTEGPRIAANSHYSDSIEVILESASNAPGLASGPAAHKLIVCSFSGALVSGIGTALGTHFTSEKIEYFNYTLRSDGTHAQPRQLLFHESWLDFGHFFNSKEYIDFNVKASSSNASSPHYDPVPFPARPRTAPPWEGNLLTGFGNITRIAGASYPGTQALPTEVLVGGALAYMISFTYGSDTQFTTSYYQLPREFTDGLGPPESWPTDYVFSVYQEGYIFRLSSRTGYLGVAVLGLHALTVIIGSLWQLVVTKRVFLGWKNTPEYLMLGAGSSSLATAYPNTCAGIDGKGALSGVIMLKATSSGVDSADSSHLRPFSGNETVTEIAGIPHLEIMAADPSDPSMMGKVDVNDTDKKYGFFAGTGGVKSKLM